jgi:ABC-type multidrug transport system fused ATPase/permease subunit
VKEMKLKTIKELGNDSDAEMSKYEKIRKTRNDINLKDLVPNCYSLPIFYLLIFFSAIVSTFISLFLLIKINDMLGLITSIYFDTVYTLLAFIFVLNLLPILIFLLSILCMSIYGSYAKQEKQIEEEIYKKE